MKTSTPAARLAHAMAHNPAIPAQTSAPVSHTPGPIGRSSLNWLVVNPEGKLIAVLDSVSEAYFFTRNRGHATDSVYFKADCDYAAAPAPLQALLTTRAYLVSVENLMDPNVRPVLLGIQAAIQSATL